MPVQTRKAALTVEAARALRQAVARERVLLSEQCAQRTARSQERIAETQDLLGELARRAGSGRYRT